MRIAWIVYGALDQPTGGYIYDRLHVDGLRAAGAHVVVVSAAPGDAPAALAARVAAADPDVVVGDGLCAPELGPAFERLAAGASRILLVHHFTSWEIERRDVDVLRGVEARAVAASDALVATSFATAERVRAEHGRLPAVVVPGADRLPLVDRAPRDPSGCALLFVGSFIPRKRLLLLLDAVERLAAPALSLRLVGDPSRDPEHAAAVAARIDRSPYLRERVARLGVVDDDALARELARADALVLPSSLEGYGMVSTEALRAGTPVVAARASAIPEVVREGAGGLLFDDAAGLGAVLARLASDGDLRAELARAAAAHAAALPTWRASSASLLAVVTEAASTARSRARAR